MAPVNGGSTTDAVPAGGRGRVTRGCEGCGSEILCEASRGMTASDSEVANIIAGSVQSSALPRFRLPPHALFPPPPSHILSSAFRSTLMSALVASAGRTRLAAAARARLVAARYPGASSSARFSSSAPRRDERAQPPQEGEAAAQPPRPPKPIDDSTSALDYKSTLRHRPPPPLPAMDLPRSRTAEEAVTNILYNTPPPSLQPFKKCVLFLLLAFPFCIHCPYRRLLSFPSVSSV